MPHSSSKPKDELLDAILEDEHAEIIAQLRASGQFDDEEARRLLT